LRRGEALPVPASRAAAQPSVSAHAPDHAKAFEEATFAAETDPAGVPALGYHWDFGDGTSESGRQVHHAYTMDGQFTVRLTIEGMDGIPAEKQMRVSVSGNLEIKPPSKYQGD